MPEVRLERKLHVPADPAAQALGEILRAIAHQEGPWRGFALHISLGELRLPDVGYVAVPVKLHAVKDPSEPDCFAIGFVAASLPAAFPEFKGTMGATAGAIGESALYLHGSYELPGKFFGPLLDAALLPLVAKRSLDNFIEEIGAAVEARVDQREDDYVRYRFYSPVR